MVTGVGMALTFGSIFCCSWLSADDTRLVDNVANAGSSLVFASSVCFFTISAACISNSCCTSNSACCWRNNCSCLSSSSFCFLSIFSLCCLCTSVIVSSPPGDNAPLPDVAVLSMALASSGTSSITGASDISDGVPDNNASNFVLLLANRIFLSAFDICLSSPSAGLSGSKIKSELVNTLEFLVNENDRVTELERGSDRVRVAKSDVGPIDEKFMLVRADEPERSAMDAVVDDSTEGAARSRSGALVDVAAAIFPCFFQTFWQV
mmetsp:Transcript_22173/g.38332  ORF Transcript_22173/g.38332 Transcript_22173/m.38332 type:complete len:264 (-) Transcript_22173:491-1282(-)